MCCGKENKAPVRYNAGEVNHHHLKKCGLES